MLNKSSEIKYHVLLAIEQYAIQYPKLVAPYYKKFYPLHLEKTYLIFQFYLIKLRYCKFIKLRILNEIIQDWNFNEIFEEYREYVNCHSKELTVFTLISIGKLASKCPKYAIKCVKYLINNVLGKNSFLASKSIVALSEYLQHVKLFLMVRMSLL